MPVRDAITAIRLKIRIKSLSYYLRSCGISCSINAQFRSRSIAHRWSTAYAIVSGSVPLGNLRRLNNGRDLDGNVWFRADWDNHQSDAVPANTIREIAQNAITLGPEQLEYAAEGYEQEDARRFPNLKAIPVSKHVTGTAIDLNVAWDFLNGPWSRESTALLSRFGLQRPIPSECWHVELDENSKPDYSSLHILRWWIESTRLKDKRRCAPKSTVGSSSWD